MSFFREQIQKPILDVVRKKRSSKWRKVRKEFLKEHPECAGCGRKKNLEVHHIEDFSTAPEKELDENNLITLCGRGIDCHFVIGHLGDFKSINPTVREDAKWLKEKVDNRR